MEKRLHSDPRTFQRLIRVDDPRRRSAVGGAVPVAQGVVPDPGGNDRILPVMVVAEAEVVADPAVVNEANLDVIVAAVRALDRPIGDGTGQTVEDMAAVGAGAGAEVVSGNLTVDHAVAVAVALLTAPSDPIPRGRVILTPR